MRAINWLTIKIKRRKDSKAKKTISHFFKRGVNLSSGNSELKNIL